MARGDDASSTSIESHLNRIHHGDNLAFLRAWPDACVDLVSIDPPFNTGATKRGRDEGVDYADAWPTIEDYLAFMRPRLIELHRVLKPTGSILLHCDWRASHHLRLLLDHVFGPERFVNHLIWTYGLGGSSPRRFARKHDDIFFYGKSDAYAFEPPMIPATSNRMKGQRKKATDVIDIPAINNMARERTGYPTQKPLALLRMLVDACCVPEGIVADVFCGSGTALVAARDSGRSWIGCDINQDAVRIARERLM